MRPDVEGTGPGRERARTRILRAAAHLYTTRGYEGTSIRAIAAAAAVTKSLVHYHFGSKKQLYATLLRESIDGCRASIHAVLAQDLAPAPRLRAMLKAQFDRAREAPEIVAFANQVLTMPAMLPIEFDSRAERRQLFDLHVRSIVDGQECGAFREVDARAVVVMVIATVAIYVSAVLAGNLPAVPPHIEDTIADLLLGGVACQPGAAARSAPRRRRRAAAPDAAARVRARLGPAARRA